MRAERRRATRRGFTLIELMIVVAILGILAAIAVPALTTYTRRAKTSQAFTTLDALFKAASAYYNRDFSTGTAATVNSTPVAHCTVAETESFADPPTDYKKAFENTDPFSETVGIGFPPGLSHYKFSNRGGIAACGQAANTSHYTLEALGDLDGDGITSSFQLATISSNSNELYKAGAVFVIDELE